MAKNDTTERIKEILNTLRPYLNMDGGDVEFIKYEENIVYVKLTGACAACMFSDETIKNGLFETLRADIPEIKDVINVVDQPIEIVDKQTEIKE
jgi:Fe-S cluster biogenesis protein NfuA